MSVLIFFVILLVLVLVHEWGHFSSAKFFKMRVDEFGFGFPPKLFGIKKGETEYSFNLLPIGGFVKIFGENPDEDSISGPDSSRSFANKPRWQQAIVLFAGVFMNFILAWLLFAMSFMFGLPSSVSNSQMADRITDANLTILSVLPDSPAEEAGLLSGDKVVYIQKGEDFVEAPNILPETLMEYVATGEELELGYLRSEDDVFDSVSLQGLVNEESGQIMIGVSMDTIGTLKLPLFRALWEGMKLNLEVTARTAEGLYHIVADSIAGKDGVFDNLAGPIGIVSIVGDAYQFGWAYLLSFAALISINLAIINMIPFPALDGGRLLFLLIEKLKGSRISPKIANITNMIGFGLLILLMVVVTYHDIVRLF